MRLLYKKINQPSKRSLHIRRECTPCLDEAWHFHEEYELIMIVRGQGKRFVGDSISDFGDNDLCLVGPNLPHLWRNDVSYRTAAEDVSRGSEKQVEVVIIQFREDFLGPSFFDVPDMYPIAELVEQAAYGLEFTHRTPEGIQGRVSKLPDLDPFDQVIELLKILHDMSVSDNYRQIASSGYAGVHDHADCERMNDVTAYLMDNFQEDVRLIDLAEVANLSSSALSRYVKERTGKTFSVLLNEVRVGHASMLLIRSNQTIAEIAYASGYRSLTNFNRQFKRLKKMTPSSFRGEHARTAG